MDIITYKDTTLNVPTDFSEVPLSVYEKAVRFNPKEPRDLVQIAALVCGVDESVFLDAPAELFDIVVDRILFIYTDANIAPAPGIKHDGVTYVVNIESKLTLAEWIDIEAAQKLKEDVISNILSIVCRPALEKYDPDVTDTRIEMFKNMTCDKILPVLAFFLQCKKIYDERMRRFSSLEQTVNLLPRSLKNLPGLGGGTKLSQIWRKIKYYFMTKLLRYRLHKFLQTLSIGEIKTRRKKRKKI